MTRYLITDAWTLVSEWIEAPTIREALIRRENELRPDRPGRPLPPTSRASHYSEGDMIDVSLADVFCRGLRAAVIRED